MVFLIKEPGLLSTIQDQGRYGYQSTGISPSGVLDYKSAILANQLVGNEPDEGVIEMTLSGMTFRVLKDTIIALAGASMEFTINGEKYPIGRSIPLAKGDLVKLGQVREGLRTYLAVAGGFKLKKVLGSHSTHLRTAMGGYKGRALEKGDKLPYNGDNKTYSPLVVKKEATLTDSTIRIVPGPNYDDLTDESKKALVNQPYTITRNSDRMGIRLDGHALETTDGVHDILSEPTQLGNIQVPKNGLPIVLLNDRQTTGGYKRMASVAKVDLPKLVQLGPNERIQFKMIDLKIASELYRSEIEKLFNKEYLTQDKDFVYYRRVKSERVEQLIER